MFRTSLRWSVAAVALLVSGYGLAAAQEHKLHDAKDGSGVFGYKDTPLQPWSGLHVHDPDRPAPKKIEPGEASTQQAVGRAPSDAIVLFGGQDLSHWQPADWIVANGYAEGAKKPLVTKQEFGDCQLHLEWQAPDPPRGHIMNRGNNGVYFLGVYEVQIFDSYTVKIYPDGQAAAIYGQTPPRVNACRPPGQWQTYDIVFLAPRFKDGKLDQPARVTMLHNGVLVHHHQEVYGETAHLLLASYRSQKSTGPLTLGAHDNPVRFRNIWIRPL